MESEHSEISQFGPQDNNLTPESVRVVDVIEGMIQSNDSPLTAAVTWTQSLLLGPIATTIAILAVAAFGFLVLSGRINWRRGVSIIIGCFILFAAPVIAAGIMASSGAGDAGETAMHVYEPPAYQPAPRQGGAICWTCGIAPANPAEK